MKSLFLIFCFFLHSYLFAQSESTDQRISHYTLQIKLFPDSISNYLYRAKAYNEKGDFKLALNDCTKALQIDKSNSEALKSRAFAYYFLNKLDSSIADLDKVLKQNKNDASAWKLRGLNYFWLERYDKAIDDYTEALRINPKDAKAWLNRGDAYFWAKKYDKAIGDISESLTYDPKNLHALSIRSMCYIKTGKYELAFTDITTGLAITPNDVDLLTNRGFAYYSSQRYELALTDFSEALRIDPNNIFAWLYRGNTYKTLGKYELAIPDFTQALLLNPQNIEALYSRGIAFYYADKNLDAINDFTEVLKLSPNYLDALTYRGDAYTEIGKYEPALKDYESALLNNPKNIDALTNRGICYKKMGKSDLAIKDFNEALRINPKYIPALHNRGNLYFDLVQYDLAIKDYTDAISADAKAFESRNNRGNIFFNQGKYDLAISDYTVILSQDPTFVQALINRANAYKFLGKLDLAIKDLSQAVTLNPSSVKAWDLRGNVYLNKNQYDSALSDFNKALQLDPKDTSSLNDRGLVYSNQKKYDKALNDFNEALRIFPNFATALNNRALVYNKLEKYDLAIEDFKKGHEIKPEDSRILVNLILAYLATDQYDEATLLFKKYRQKHMSSYIEEYKSWSFLLKYITACCDYLVNKNYSNALQLLQQSLEEYKNANPDIAIEVPITREYTNVLLKTGFITEQLKQYDQALAYYQKALIINPGNTRITAKIENINKTLDGIAKTNKTLPEIRLLDPVPSANNVIQKTSTDDKLFIGATVKDISGVEWVKVNGAKVETKFYDKYGVSFKTNISANADNLTIQAANKNGLISSVNYKIETIKSSDNNSDIIPVLQSEHPKFHAVLIACSHYNNQKWNPLPTTVDEAKAYKKVLMEKYGFESENIVELYDIDRREILNRLDSKAQSLKENDNLLILFAGHGWWNKDVNNPKGYWVPINTGTEKELPDADYISVENIDGILRLCKAKHILLLSDACYSAAFRSGNDDDLPTIPEYTFKSRQILTSGGLGEKVPSKSVFIKMVIATLQQKPENNFTVKDLLNGIYKDVQATTGKSPTLNDFGSGSLGGQFYFIRSKERL